ncbi:MAG TPA: NAD(P)/FAD-dependent oxidoreductase [Bacteroidales bacterium]|nr:NAD(P)/FAD-dependent oxidoreductase [Bacteroidales bacterium]
MQYDVIIIGGGLGGLFAGAKLSKEGKSVLLLEQHDRPGGCATTFTRKGFTMEVGLHEMDGLHPADGKNKIFNDLGVFDKVEFLPLPEFYRFIHQDTDLVMPHNKEAAISLLKDKFPDQSKGIDTYFNRLMNARRINTMERNKPDSSIGDYLDSIFTNEEIKLFLLGNLGYFHDDPYSLSLKYFSMAEGAYFNGRANFIKGGSQKLSNAMVDIIRENGGKVLLNHKVSSIQLDENNKVTGLRFINSLPGNHTMIECTAKDIVANASLSEIAGLLGVNNGKIITDKTAKQTIGASLITVYLGFEKALKDMGHKYYSTFVFDDSIKTMRDIKENNQAWFDKRSFTFIDYSQIDSALAPEGKSVGSVCAIDYYDNWDKMDNAEYKVKKREAQQLIIERLGRIVPGIPSNISHVETGTAKTVKRYTLNPEGAVYGFAKHPDNKPVGPIPEIENLHIASAWGKFGGGFSGAIFGGYMTAIDMLRRKD